MTPFRHARPTFLPLALGILALAPVARAQVVDNRIPLNYNFHGMAHAGEATAASVPANADLPNGYRSISDRGLIFDVSNIHSIAAYSGQNIGATGISYAFYDTLGPVSNPAGLDIVHLGARCGTSPGLVYAYEASANTGTVVGIAPAWNVCDQSGTPGVSPLTTTISPGLLIDANAELGILYHGSDGGGQFNVVLGFSDGSSLPPIAVACPDWFGNAADPAIVLNQPLSVQQKLRHIEGSTTFFTFQGAYNNDAPRIGTWSTSNLGPNLNVMEAVISFPKIVAGVGVGTGSWAAHPEVVGKTLTSITFLDAGGTLTFPAGGRGYAVFAATLRSGQPANASCGTAQNINLGDTVSSNLRASGAAPSGCGVNDGSAVWFRYVASAAGAIDARTCGATTNFDTVLSVYDACGGGVLPIGCDDDSCSTASHVQWVATAGTAYYLRVAGNNGATGAFTLHINDPGHLDVAIPLALNFNGICHGPLEQTLPVNTGTTHENRCDLNSYRSIADKGLFCDGVVTNALNSAGTVGFQSILYKIVSKPNQLDIVHLGNRNLAANSSRQFVSTCPASGSNSVLGMQPTWLPNVDQTGPQTTATSALDIVFGAATRLGVLYHVSNVDSVATLASYDITLTFTDNSSATVTAQATDWSGTNTQVLPAAAAGSGLEVQRLLGTFHAVQSTDQAIDTNTTAKVLEAVISTSSLIARTVGAGSFDPTGKTLASITFGNPRSGNAAHDSFYSGFSIFAATVHDPATYNPNYGPSAVGNFSPNPIIAGTSGVLGVTVSRGTGAPNAISSVTVNASAVGLSPSLSLNDSGMGGDSIAGDNVWSAAASIPFASPTGVRTLPFGVIDAQGRTASGNIVFTVNPPNPGDDRRPITPTITEPEIPGQVLNASDVHMVTANFESPVAAPNTPEHLCTDWEIWKTSTNTRVWRATCVTEGALKVHIHLADGIFEGPYVGRTTMEYSTNYQLRVRHRDDSGDPVSEYSYWAARNFSTAAPTQIFPLEGDDFLDSPIPTWQLDGGGGGGGGGPVLLPTGASLILGSAHNDLLLRIDGTASGNALTNPGEIDHHVAVRVTVAAPPASGWSVAPSTVTVVDHECIAHHIFLPQITLSAGGVAYYWVTSSGTTYVAAANDASPVFITLARGTQTPWEIRQDGYVVETFATGLQLPVNMAFAPNAANATAGEPYMYVTELYGQVMVITRDGTVSVYAPNQLNFNPTGLFPGSGEVGVTGLCVEPTTGDLFVTMLYATSPPSPSQLRPKIVRMHSNDGGLTMATTTTILTFPSEPQGQSHQISNITIGPDGKLYVHMGDGFDQTKGQDLSSARGKILRLNLDGTIPTDNPFYNAADGLTPRDQVWVYGLRNPFGGGWRTSDSKHFTVENGPSNDRLFIAVPGRNYGYTGSDESMDNFNIVGPPVSCWYPAHGPVNIEFIQTSTFNGSGFPASKLDHAFVTESGPTFGQGPQTLGKRIVEFVLAPTTGDFVSGPSPLVEYTGSGYASCVGIAAGPDGLYFSELYKDLNTSAPLNPTIRGASILRVRYVGATGGCPTCPPDFNGHDGLNVQDIFDFLNAWFAGDPRADFNGLDAITVQDIFDFLNAWFIGC